ncbi:MAG: hypothetical protein K0S93_486 [Nitrososphaeraceae archaeon]|nr:hypothetical protein [Nitrososphaeraceae archaeon]
MSRPLHIFFVYIFLVIAAYTAITTTQHSIDPIYAQNLIKEEYINPDYNGQRPFGSFYKVIIECEDIDSSCFDNILSQTGITSISAYYSFAQAAREPCVSNINDPLCDFERTNELSYTNSRIESRLTVNSGNFFIIALNHDGTSIISGSITKRTTSPQGQEVTVESGNVRLQFLTRTITDIPAANADIDQDSIPDNTELNGIIDPQGNRVANLAQMGADPCRKTVLVESDYMEVNRIFGHSHKPSQGSIDEVIEMFNNAPVAAVSDQDCPYDGFPRKSTGINLIVDIDDSISEINPIDFARDTNGNPADDFNTIRDNHFDPNLKPYFHYNLWAHQFRFGDGTIASNTGIAEHHGNDFIVSYGGIPLGFILGQIGEGGTFAHELGHNLGLDHGGGDDTNCKPNYLSIMNYNFQIIPLKKAGGFLGIGIPFLDYSRAALPTLDERHLNENTGIGDDNIITIWRLGSGVGNQPLDWNGNSRIESDVNADLNYFNTFRGSDCKASPNQPALTGYNDWANLDYNFTDNLGNYLDGIGRDAIIEITPEEIEQFRNIWDLVYNADLQITKQSNLSEAIPGDIITYTVIVKNIGNSQASNISLVDTFPDGTIENRTLDNLNPGEFKTEMFNFTVPQLKPIKDEIILVNRAEVNGFDLLGNPDNIIENNKANASTVIPTSEISSIAKCNLDDIATGGGFVLDGNAIINSFKPLNTENGWNATAIVFGTPGITKGSTGNVTAHVVCLDR